MSKETSSKQEKEKKTLKEVECISCQDNDTLCGGYGSKHCLKEFKTCLAAELQTFLYPAIMGDWIRRNSDANTIREFITRLINEKVLGRLGVEEEHSPLCRVMKNLYPKKDD